MVKPKQRANGARQSNDDVDWSTQLDYPVPPAPLKKRRTPSKPAPRKHGVNRDKSQPERRPRQRA